MKATEEAIDAAASFGSPSVICFTGYSARNPSDPKSKHIAPEKGAKNCVEGLKKIIGYAEKKNIDLCVEMLNSRETSHPMKGHPGYQGDHVDYCIDIIKRVDLPRMKLLFDVYHVQIQDGDVIRRLHQNKEYIGHVHVAGNPGRGELDTNRKSTTRPSCRRCWTSSTPATWGRSSFPPAIPNRVCAKQQPCATSSCRYPLRGIRQPASVQFQDVTESNLKRHLAGIGCNLFFNSICTTFSPHKF